MDHEDMVIMRAMMISMIMMHMMTILMRRRRSRIRMMMLIMMVISRMLTLVVTWKSVESPALLGERAGKSRPGLPSWAVIRPG